MPLVDVVCGMRPTQVRRILLQRLLFSVLALGIGTGPATASETSPAPTQVAAKAAAPVKSAPAKAQISLLQARFLVRSILLTVNDANLTGNYSVLRDIAHPTFREKNTQADLAIAFAELRKQKLDLAAVALLEPEFARAPEVSRQNTLQLNGAYATRPLQIAFDLTFVQTGQAWRVAAISVGLAPPAAASPSAALRPTVTD